MSHITPKTNWNNENIGDSDLNRIEENIRVQHQGGGIADGDALVSIESTGATGYDLDVGTEYDTFLINVTQAYDPQQPELGGLFTIDTISTTGRSATNEICIINTGVGIVWLLTNGTPGSGYAAIRSGSGTYVLQAGGAVKLKYSGAYWHVIGVD